MRTITLSNLLSGTFLTALLALSACNGTEESFSTLEEQARLSAVIEGPVPVPLLPSVASELGVGQILCDSYQLRAGDDDDDEADEEDEVYAAGDRGALSGMSQCVRTAKRMYREMQVQLVLLKHPSTVDRGLEMVSAKTTVLFPDGSYTQGNQGASGFAASYSKLFDSQQVVAIQNKFIYKPIDKHTVIVIGDPAYTMAGGAPINSVQFQVYTRSPGGGGRCRSLAHLTGKVCWSQVAAEWAYTRPFGGISIPHPTSTVRSHIPTSASYPAVLEPERIVCDGAFRARPGDALNCEQLAREFYKEIQFQILTLTDPSTVGSGLATLNAATTFVYPTGLVTEGITALGVYTPSLFGEGFFPVGLQNKFLYKAIDSETVLFIGSPVFTMFNFTDGTVRTTESIQMSLYRRNATSLGNCRSASNLTGDVCWNEVAEQWVYGQPVLGG